MAWSRDAQTTYAGESTSSTPSIDLSFDTLGTGDRTVLLVLHRHRNSGSGTSNVTVTWDPTGDNIAFTKDVVTGHGSFSEYISEIYRVELTSSNAQSAVIRLTATEVSYRFYVAHAASYSGLVTGAPEASNTSGTLSASVTSLTDGALIVSGAGLYHDTTGSTSTASSLWSLTGGTEVAEGASFFISGGFAEENRTTAGAGSAHAWSCTQSGPIAESERTVIAAYAPAATGTTEDMSGTSAGTSTDTAAITLEHAVFGTVTDGATAEEGAEVYLIDVSDDTLYGSQVTDANGEYRFSNVPAGTYHATVYVAGKAATSQNVTVG